MKQIELNKFILEAKELISSQYDAVELRGIVNEIIGSIMFMSPLDIELKRDCEVSQDEWDRMMAIVNRVKIGEPIQYVLGLSSFYGLEFNVSEAVLIPRPETEELVEWILTDVDSLLIDTPLDILDIGVGSGAISIALASKLPKANLFGVDISKSALSVAKSNAERNRVVVDYRELNILDVEERSRLDVIGDKKWSVIVSNPPYVRELEKVEIRKNVLDYEPDLALFVEDDDPLLFYREIAIFAKERLREDGILYFEINQYLGKETVSLIESIGFSRVELREDLSGNDRMIKAQL